MACNFPTKICQELINLIPDVTYQRKRKNIRGVLITHDYDISEPFRSWWKRSAIPNLHDRTHPRIVMNARMISKTNNPKYPQLKNRPDIRLGSFSVEFFSRQPYHSWRSGFAISTPIGTTSYRGFQIRPFSNQWCSADVAKIARLAVKIFGSDVRFHRFQTPAIPFRIGIAKTLDEIFEQPSGPLDFRHLFISHQPHPSVVAAAEKHGRKVAVTAILWKPTWKLRAHLDICKTKKGTFIPISKVNEFRTIKWLSLHWLARRSNASYAYRQREHRFVKVHKDELCLELFGYSSNERRYNPLWIPSIEKSQGDYYKWWMSTPVDTRAKKTLKWWLIHSPEYLIPFMATILCSSSTVSWEFPLVWTQKIFHRRKMPSDWIWLSPKWQSDPGKRSIANVMVDGLGVGDIGKCVARPPALAKMECLSLLLLT